AGGKQTTSKCCLLTTGEEHLISRNDSDGEFSVRVTEASDSEARQSSRNPIFQRVSVASVLFNRKIP
ncbi:MAG: hypothetical protein IJ532_06225, partial [Alphaproteobacteria bacterium]|nr:hypothetical protein [Alphaproteobacteria bacterium]